MLIINRHRGTRRRKQANSTGKDTMKKRRYTAKLLSMAVAANLVFSSLAMPVFSADLSGLETELSTEMQGETETTAVSYTHLTLPTTY